MTLVDNQNVTERGGRQVGIAATIDGHTNRRRTIARRCIPQSHGLIGIKQTARAAFGRLVHTDTGETRNTDTGVVVFRQEQTPSLERRHTRRIVKG